MLEVTKIETDNLKKTFHIKGLDNYLVCKFYKETHYIIYGIEKGKDKNNLIKEKFENLDHAFKYLEDKEKKTKVRVGYNLLSKEHLNKSEEELGESISDIQKRVSDRVGKVFDPRTDQYVSIKTKDNN